MPIDPSSKLYFEASGPAAAPSIVFLHGGGLAGWMWRKQVEALNSSYHCLVPDLPEQGRNTRTATEPYTAEGAADRIAELIRGQAYEGRAHVVGLSEGAQVVVAMLSRIPEVIDHAVVSSAILRPIWANRFTSPAIVGWSHRLFVEPLRNNDWWIRLNMLGNGIPDDFYPDFKKSFQTTEAPSLVHMMSAAMQFRLPAGLDKADKPTLIVVGSKEYLEMKESAKDLLRVLPHARGVIVSLGPQATLAQEHGWAMNAPELFTATVKAWIEDRPLPPELLPLN